MTFFLKIVFGLILLTAINSCTYSQNAKIPPKECIELNNRGVTYLMKFPYGERDINEAINLFKQAIDCDSTYLLAYINIANAYERKHSYTDEMKAYNIILVLTNNNDPTILMMKGTLFERINNIDSAKNYYYSAKKGYEKELIKHPDNAEVIKEIILLKALTDGKDEAIKEIDKQIKLHPELREKLSGEYEYYKFFNRHNYVYNLPTEVDN
jgi:tetratricopeptide (TPR) repeat protein